MRAPRPDRPRPLAAIKNLRRKGVTPIRRIPTPDEHAGAHHRPGQEVVQAFYHGGREKASAA
ncbi:hypothetical protein GCM10007079_18450 [Nocardiopsis terrae]|nr:hypothetical protein GCM10007079_18450 [Nocardiopsis terrae]